MHTAAAAAEEDIGIQNSPLTMYIMLAQLHLQRTAVRRGGVVARQGAVRS